MLEFGERVRLARLRAGMTQAELAAAIRVSHSSVRDWEARGRTPRQADVYRRIAEETGVSGDFILGLADDDAADAAQGWAETPEPE